MSGLLRWIAGGSGHDIIFFCGVRYRTWQRNRWIVLEALLDIYYKNVVVLPTTEEARSSLSELFKMKNGIEGQLGAIDGLLLHITLPPGTRNARKFLCYKQYYALNMQAVAGPTGEFLYLNIGHAGATGDGCAIRGSSFWAQCQANLFKYTEGYHFISDAAYGLMPWNMCPFPDTVLGTAQDVYNLQLSKARQVVERAFGMTIRRFRILASSLHYGIVKNVKIAKLCCMLHNLTLQDRASNKILVNASDDKRQPFIAKERLVPRVLYHELSYREEGIVYTAEELEAQKDKVLKDAAIQRRALISSQLRTKGYKRQQERGKNRGAAYQQADAYNQQHHQPSKRQKR